MYQVRFVGLCALGLCGLLSAISGCTVTVDKGSSQNAGKAGGGASFASAAAGQGGPSSGGSAAVTELQGGGAGAGQAGSAVGAGGSAAVAGAASLLAGAANAEIAGSPSIGGAGGGTGVAVDWIAVIEAARTAIVEGRTAIDLTGDGLPDYYRTLAGAATSREEIDADGDGTTDLVWDYSQATKTFRRDDNHDGNFEEALDVTADLAEPTIVSYVETLDSGSDGAPDVVRKWTVDPSIATIGVEVQEDTDSDGTLDWSITNTVQRQQRKFASVSTSGANACSADQAAKIDAAVNQAVEQAMGCLAASNPSLGMKFAKFLANSNITFGCDSNTSDPYCGSADMADTSAPWFGKREVPISLDGPAFDPTKCGPLASTIFHEMMHYVNGLHQYGDGSTDPGDSVYGCEKMCFGVLAPDGSTSTASNLECAACLGVKADSSKCKKFPQKPCPTAPAQCPCKGGTLYPDALKCSVGCPSGLACFTARCKERGPCAK